MSCSPPLLPSDPDLPNDPEFHRLAGLLDTGEVLVLTGAGISTDSGIPDYRGPTGVLRANLPMTIQDFRASPAGRRRYWARSQLGWRRIAGAEPNANHRAVTALQEAGRLTGVITQNVDGLHQAAETAGVIDLHGNLDRVVCLNCAAVISRRHMDELLRERNGDADIEALQSAALRPDGDVALPESAVENFVLAECESCGSDLLKPDVVFFGENVPKARVSRCFELLERSQSLLVLGSSLTVMSGLRFVLRAAQENRPVAIVNQGVTRGDPHATIRIDAPLANVLGELVRP